MTILLELAKKGCRLCLGTGITFVNDGEDDVVEDYCTCYAGQQKQYWDQEELRDAAEREQMDLRDLYDFYNF